MSCQGGLTNCNGVCANLTSDNANCGACGKGCAAGEACTNGVCALSCQAGLTACNGVCVNQLADNQNCGGCAKPCAAGQMCSNGTCSLSCQAGLSNCGGVCTNPTFDPLNCGACGTKCAGGANAATACAGGNCGYVCNPGFGDCNGLSADGCETNTATSLKSCGTCGNACSAPANATAGCNGGACGIGACNAGYGNCDGNAANGCETNTLTDANNCGSCGKVCGAATPTCTAGSCVNGDLSGVFSQYSSAGRTVYIWKTPPCAPLANYTNFCQSHGLKWWSPKSQADAQQLVTYAYNLDSYHTWVQVYGLVTTLGTIGGYSVTVDSAGCVAASSSGFAGFRKWACSFCDPETNGNVSCCWDGASHAYDWFVCEP